MSLRFFTFGEPGSSCSRDHFGPWPKFVFHDPVAAACWNLLYVEPNVWMHHRL
jgi:hypothetical protein